MLGKAYYTKNILSQGVLKLLEERSLLFMSPANYIWQKRPPHLFKERKASESPFSQCSIGTKFYAFLACLWSDYCDGQSGLRVRGLRHGLEYRDDSTGWSRHDQLRPERMEHRRPAQIQLPCRDLAERRWHHCLPQIQTTGKNNSYNCSPFFITFKNLLQWYLKNETGNC